MTSPQMPVRLFGVTIAIVAFLTLTAMRPTVATAADDWPRKVQANYAITLAGVKFGQFNFSSSRNGAQYTVASNAKLRAFFGAFKWRGSANSTGAIVNSSPIPATYNYTARKKKKTPRTVAMTMAKRNVTGLTVTPPVNPSKNRVPVHAKDKLKILDPMSAIIALTAPVKARNPCRQSVSIFDGKHRFDVQLSAKGTKSVGFAPGNGFSSKARVCRVRYVPISGHKTGKKNSYMVDKKGAEVWMIRTADGSMYMPYRIVVPTVLGDAMLQARAINVELANNRRIALRN